MRASWKCVAVLSWLLPVQVAAQETAGFLPTALTARPLGTTSVALVVSNPTTASLAVRGPLELRIPAGMGASVDETLPEAIRPQGTLVIPLILWGAPAEGKDRLTASLPTRRGERDGLLHAELEVTRGGFLTGADVATVEVRTSLTALNDGTRDTLVLEIRNQVEYPVSVAPPRGTGPPFITMEPVASDTIEIGPGSSRLVRVSLEVSSRVKPGSQLLAFSVPISWLDPGGTHRHAELHAFHPVSVGVLGESDILKLLAVPSFLLLPGFLMLVAANFVLAQNGQRVWASNDPKKPEFWLFGVTLSLLAMGVLSAFGIRYFTFGYGIGDLAWVWFFSVFIGAVTAVVVVRRRRGRAERAEADRKRAEEEAQAARQREEQAHRDRTPADGDDALSTLRKMKLRSTGRIPHQLRVARVTASGTRGVELLSEGDAVWIAPAIEYRWSPGATREQQRHWLEAVNADDVAKLIELVDRGVGPVLQWDQNAGFSGPAQLPTSEIVFEDEQRFIQEADDV